MTKRPTMPKMRKMLRYKGFNVVVFFLGGGVGLGGRWCLVLLCPPTPHLLSALSGKLEGVRKRHRGNGRDVRGVSASASRWG